jgi:hypothetical protein
MLGAARIARTGTGELDDDLIQRLPLHLAQPGRGSAEHRLQGLRDRRSLGEVAVRHRVRGDQLVKCNGIKIAYGARWCAIRGGSKSTAGGAPEHWRRPPRPGSAMPGTSRAQVCRGSTTSGSGQMA